MLRQNKPGLRLWAILFWLLLWQCAALLVGQDFLLASPLTTLSRFLALALTGDFWRAALFSLLRILLGFLLGLALGLIAAALAHRRAWLRSLLAPLLHVLRAIPVASFVIVALIWLPSRRLSTLIAFIIVFPLVYAEASAALARVDVKLVELAQLFRMPRRRKYAYIYALPALRGMSGALTAAMGLAWKSGVAAELISMPAGSIGERLYTAKVYLMTGDLFAWTLLIVLLSAVCARLLRALLSAIAARLEGA